MLSQASISSFFLVVMSAIAGCGETSTATPAKGTPAAATTSAATELVQQDRSGWATDAAQTLTAAKQEGRLVLADFTGSDWCGWCIKLDAEVFSTPRFREWAAGHVRLLKIDFPRGKAQTEALKSQNERLQEKYGIQGFPTVLILDGDGKSLGQLGYVPGGPDVWIKQAEAIMQSAGR